MKVFVQIERGTSLMPLLPVKQDPHTYLDWLEQRYSQRKAPISCIAPCIAADLKESSLRNMEKPRHQLYPQYASQLRCNAQRIKQSY